MSGYLTLLGTIANLVLTIWAIRRALRNQHHLNAFASGIRWAVIFAGVTGFFAAFHFLGTGLLGTYVAFFGGGVALFFLVFRDAAFYLGKSLRNRNES
jgi:hypothetical protein